MTRFHWVSDSWMWNDFPKPWRHLRKKNSRWHFRKKKAAITFVNNNLHFSLLYELHHLPQPQDRRSTKSDKSTRWLVNTLTSQNFFKNVPQKSFRRVEGKQIMGRMRSFWQSFPLQRVRPSLLLTLIFGTLMHHYNFLSQPVQICHRKWCFAGIHISERFQ